MSTAGRPRAVFFGSPAFAVPALRATAASTELVAVVSQPDRPAGRGQAETAPAVKVAARELGVEVLQPASVRTPETLQTLAGLQADLFIVVAYGRILPQVVLDLPRLGPFNVHASLLPKLRGAAPIQWAIIRGDSETGVALMRMEAGLDTGPVAAVRRLPIADDDTTGSLSVKLAELGAGLLVDTIPVIAAGAVTPVRQDDAGATLAPMLSKADGVIDFRRPARLVSAQARGVDPWPGATAMLGETPLRLFGPRVLSEPAPGRSPGEVVGVRDGRLVIACGDSETASVAFAELQLPGRRRLAAPALLAGHPIAAGTRLGGP